MVELHVVSVKELYFIVCDGHQVASDRLSPLTIQIIRQRRRTINKAVCVHMCVCVHVCVCVCVHA